MSPYQINHDNGLCGDFLGGDEEDEGTNELMNQLFFYFVF